MTFGPNPGIWADAVRKALNPNDEHAARARQTGAEQAQLDREELRELELSGVYEQTSRAPGTTQARDMSRIRSAIARIFGRST